MHLVYSVASILLSAASLTVFVMKFPHILEEIKKTDSPAARFITPSSLVGMAVLLALLTAAWPTFCLIWFGAVKRDARDLDGGIREDAVA